MENLKFFNSYLTKKTFPSGLEKVFIKCCTEPPKNTKKKNQVSDQHKIESCLNSLYRAKQVLIDLADCNVFSYFLTLTFSNEKVDRLDDSAVMSKFKIWRKYFKEKFPYAFYIAVPEYHKLGGLHFHLLIGGITASELQLADSGKVCCSFANKKVCAKNFYENNKQGKQLSPTDGLTIYNVGCWKNGFATATEVISSEACKFYVIKYLNKGEIDIRFFNKKRFFASQNLIRPYVEKQTTMLGAYSSNKKIQGFLYLKPHLDIIKQLEEDGFCLKFSKDNKSYLVFEKEINKNE